MSHENIMLDLETLDNRETAVILSIGAVRFDFDSLTLSTNFYSTVSPEDCQKYGLTIGADTVAWWMRQSQAARDAVFTMNAQNSLKTVLGAFTHFVRDIPESKVWGNGATFDNMIMRNAYRAVGYEIPWAYYHDRCFRTMKAVFPTNTPLIEKDPQMLGVKHQALDDATRQAKWLLHIWKNR